MRTPLYKNVLSLFFSGVFAHLVNFFVTIYLARIFVPDEFGKIAFAMAISMYISIFSTWGMAIWGTKEISLKIQGPRRVYFQIAGFRVLFF